MFRQQQETNPMLIWWREWNMNTPLVTKASIGGLTLIGLVAVCCDLSLPQSIGNCTQFTVLQYQLYRIFLSCFALVNPIDWFLCVYSLSSLGPRIELAIGSISFLILMIVLSIATNLAFNLVTLVFAFNPLYPMPMFLLYPCVSFWPILFGLLVEECMSDPESRRQIWPCLPSVVVQSKHIPLVLIAIFSLLFGPQLSTLLAVGIGYLHAAGFFHWTLPSSTRLELWETRWRLGARLPGFIESSNAGGFSCTTGSRYEALGGLPTRTLAAAPLIPPSARSNTLTANETRNVIHHPPPPPMDRASIRETLAAAAEGKRDVYI